ncbi:MAG TPA: GNAT family N-acyltransferase [Mycobacteriales bacterium]|nr:GNAT family N-acyltransferase [Mycobacteriales bacterium]
MYVVRTLTHPDEIIASQRLRADICAGEGGYLTRDHVLPDGTERDQYDERCVHAGVFGPGGALVGTVRLISAADDELPIARHYGVRTSVQDLEVSRLVVHPEHRRSLVVLALFHWVVWESLDRDTRNLFAVLERPLLDNLRTVGFPFVELGEPKCVYRNILDLPVACEASRLLPGVRRADSGREWKLYDFFGRRFHDGLVPNSTAG